MIKNRYLNEIIVEDLADKMVFVGGPRQVGKTTLSTDIVSRHFKSYGYFNWDNRHDRKKIMASEWPGDAELLILDEIHKYKKWKTLLKGEYDKLKHTYKFLVTGSSRLDIYRRGGDSLQGRYHYFRLHPFTLAEILEKKNRLQPFSEIAIGHDDHAEELEGLMRFGGFPEPLFKQNKKTYWGQPLIKFENYLTASAISFANSLSVSSRAPITAITSPVLYYFRNLLNNFFSLLHAVHLRAIDFLCQVSR